MPHPTLQRLLVVAVCLVSFLVACAEGSVEGRLEKAQRLLEQADAESAIPVLRSILDDEPDHGQANLLLGLSLQQTNQLTLAVWPLEKAAADPAYAVRAGLLLASVHQALGAHDDAIRAANRVLEASPDSVEALRLRAQSHLSNKQFDEAIGDARRLVEVEPENAYGYGVLAGIYSDLKRYDESEAVIRRAIEVTQDVPEQNEGAYVLLALFLHTNVEDSERAEQAFLEGLRAHPDSARLRQRYITFLLVEGRLAEAEERLRQALEQEPENLGLRAMLADTILAQDREEDAEAVLVAATEDLPSPASYERLARFRLGRGDYAGAREAAERAFEFAPGNDLLRLLLAEVRILAGDPEAARELASGGRREATREFVAGMVALDQERYAAALESFERGLRTWPEHIGARFNAGIAAQGLGRWERALEEYSEAARGELKLQRDAPRPFQTQAILQLARLTYRMGRYEAAIRWSSNYLGQQPPEYEAMLIQAQALARKGDVEPARKALQNLLDSPVGPQARFELARLAVEAGDAAAFQELVDTVDLADPDHFALLALKVDQENEARGGAAALALVDGALAKRGDDPELLALRGRALYGLGRREEARAALDRALAVEPEHPRALADLATLTASGGDVEQGLELMIRAAQAAPHSADYAYQSGQLALLLGRRDEAERWLREAIRREPGQPSARNDLAWLLATEPSTRDEALDLASAAYRLEPAPAFADTLGWIHYLRGEYSLAVGLLEVARRELPGDASVRYHLGMTLARQGERERALGELRAAVEAGGFPEIEQARVELAQLEAAGS